MRPEETTEKERRVLLSNPADCKKTSQKKDWSVVIVESSKRGPGNEDGEINLWSSVHLPGLQHHQPRLLKHQDPSSKWKVFVIERHASLKLCLTFKLIESKASSAITWAVNKIYCLMMDFVFCRLEWICLCCDLWDWGENTKHNMCFCCTEKILLCSTMAWK